MENIQITKLKENSGTACGKVYELFNETVLNPNITDPKSVITNIFKEMRKNLVNKTEIISPFFIEREFGTYIEKGKKKFDELHEELKSDKSEKTIAKVIEASLKSFTDGIKDFLTDMYTNKISSKIDSALVNENSKLKIQIVELTDKLLKKDLEISMLKTRITSIENTIGARVNLRIMDELSKKDIEIEKLKLLTIPKGGLFGEIMKKIDSLSNNLSTSLQLVTKKKKRHDEEDED